MLDKQIIHLLRTFVLLFMAGVLCCCADDRESFRLPDDPQKEVTFSVQMPPSTYALSSAQEDQVETIEVLLFSGGNYAGSPIYRGSADITTTPSNSRVKTFTVKIPEGNYDVVVLANSRLAINAVHAAIDADPNKSKSYVLSKIVQSVSGKWNATLGSGGYVSIPMWGEIANLTVSSAVSAQTVNLTRMLAKIDVSVAAAAQPKFKLRSVHLYNYYNRGYVVPQVAAWTTTPSPVTASRTLGPLNYTTMTTPDKACAGEMYTFEAPAGSSANHLTNTCIVVGGLYNGSSTLTYYRIDFNQTGSGTVTYRPLLRNHSYTVSIADVEGAGLGSVDDAFKSRTVKIQADILAWNDGAMSDVVSDGQHKLQVSKGEFTFTREARTATSPDNVLSITTDVSTGWKVLKITDASNNDVNIDTNGATGWIRLSPNNKNNAGSVDTRILLNENTSGGSRTAKIHINAGRLTYVVIVTQNTAAALMLSLRDVATNTIDISDLVFVAGVGTTPAAQSVKLSWMPIDKAVAVSRSQVGGNPFFAYSSGDQLGSSLTSITDPSGARTLTIQPPAMTATELTGNPFLEKISKIDFTVNNGAGGYISKSLFLRQFVYNMVHVVEDVYMMTGGQRSFAVRANAPFTVTLKTNPNNVVSNLSTSGAVNTTASGTPVYFDIYNDFPTPTLFQKEVVVTVKSVPEGLFPTRDVTLKCVSGIVQPKANSYMVVPNSTPILIPVSRANESMLGAIQLGTNESFSVDLLWTDKPHSTWPVEGMGTNAAVKTIEAVGTGASGYVLVIPGSGTGNAIVCIKNASNWILWSWHIWVTGYKPYDANGNPVGIGNGSSWMDRNLGAVTNTPGAVTTKGLLYQWGRKDAFPGSSSINGNSESAIYNNTSQFAIVKMVVSSTSNFVNSVTNPSTFYYGTANNDYDWFSSSNNTHNDALWGHGTAKTVYDPCPVGWRVPQKGDWTATGWSAFTNYGCVNNNYGGYYPVSGGLYSVSGTLGNVGGWGFYWARTPDGNNADGMSISSDGYRGSIIMPSRANGFSVRCVRE